MAQAPTKPAAHRWSFYRAGGVDQVRLDKGADIFALDQLDQKLWVALGCPVKGLEIDARSLELLDSDNDGYVRPPEILGAVRWLRDVLVSADVLAKGEDGVPLANLRKDTAEGRTLLASAQHILQSLGKADATAITVADAMLTTDVFAKAKRNGDGVVPPETVADAKASAVAADIVACTGGAPDRSGKLGYDQKMLDAFLLACAEFEAWHKVADADAKTVLPFGDGTAAAFAAFSTVRKKVDDFFGRCKLAAFDPRALAAVNREEAVYMAAAAQDLTITASEVAHLPLATIEAGKSLPLGKGLNPAWADAVAAFRATCCKEKETLNEADWTALCNKLEGHAAWLAKKGGALVERLGRARVQEILAANVKAALQKASDDDLAVAGEVDAMTRVERLTRLHRDFARLLNNYVSFADFYSRRGAIFQAGTLYLDSRSLDLCFHVHDAAKHASMAPMANAYLAYVDCSRPGGQKMQLACAFTAGDSDHLFPGRNGIFYDRKGLDWNATITKIVDNPISIRQAFWLPYKKVLRWIQEQVSKRAAAAQTGSGDKLTAAAGKVGDAAATGKPAEPKKFDPSVVALFSVAIAGITGVVGTIISVFTGMGPWLPVGLLAVILGISGPSMVIAWMKLRQRNLGPLLDANGWAVNTLTRVNIPLGSSLTELPKLPPGAERSLVDPFAPKKSVWPRLILVLLVLGGIVWGLWRTNLLHKWLPDYVGPYYVETDLVADKTSALPDETITFTVKSGLSELHMVMTQDGKRTPLPNLPVPADGKVIYKVPADMKPCTLTVGDVATPSVTITVVVAPKK